jgi:penicillin-binding protein 1A
LTIETTLNLDWQGAAEEAVKETVERDGRNEGFEQAALVAIDPRNGQIKAMVGGKDFYNQQFNRVTQAQRQPGSTFKTFVYSTAIAAGISPNRGYLDAPLTVDGYTPKNYSDQFRGWINIRDALTSSINIVAVKTLIDVGWDPDHRSCKKNGH